MFNLVNDVESYPRFLPWCSAGTLLKHEGDLLCGEIEVSRVGVKQKFSTCNRLFPFERIEIQLNEGPFQQLEGEWRFTRLREDACKVELILHFEFSGRLINKAFGTVFSQVANSLVDAFCQRANEVYGNG